MIVMDGVWVFSLSPSLYYLYHQNSVLVFSWGVPYYSGACVILSNFFLTTSGLATITKRWRGGVDVEWNRWVVGSRTRMYHYTDISAIIDDGPHFSSAPNTS